MVVDEVEVEVAGAAVVVVVVGVAARVVPHDASSKAGRTQRTTLWLRTIPPHRSVNHGLAHSNRKAWKIEFSLHGAGF